MAQRSEQRGENRLRQVIIAEEARLAQQQWHLREVVLAHGAEHDAYRSEMLNELGQVHGQREQQSAIIQRLHTENMNAFSETARMQQVVAELQEHEK